MRWREVIPRARVEQCMIVIMVERDVCIEVFYGCAVCSLVGESELESVKGFADVGKYENDQLVGDIEESNHLDSDCSGAQNQL